MSRVKDIRVRPIHSSRANDFIRRHHYSGKVVPNSQLHFGAFLDNALHGVLSFGPSMDKSKTVILVRGTKWNEFIELNRMAFDDKLPKNSESRCIAVTLRELKKKAPHIKWVVSFSDGTMSGDGTIYRACGFLLTQIKKNTTIYEFPDGERIASLTLTNSGDLTTRRKIAKKYGAKFTSSASMKPFIDIGAKRATGYQLRYIYFLDKSYEKHLASPVLPYSDIDKWGAGMLRGEKISLADRQQV